MVVVVGIPVLKVIQLLGHNGQCGRGGGGGGTSMMVMMIGW